MVNINISSKDKEIMNKILFEYYSRCCNKDIKMNLLDEEQILELKKMESLKYIENLKITSENNFNIVVHKVNFNISESLISWLKDSKVYSKKWNNNHDKIIYKCMEILSNNDDYHLFSDFELGVGARPDLFIIKKNEDFLNMKPIVLEIKHSRSDFLSDIKKPEKRASYLNYCSQMYYVCLENVIRKEEVPEECGLIYLINDQELKIIKDIQEKPVKQESNIKTLLTLLVRSQPYNLNIQISMAKDESKMLSVLTSKYEARKMEKSFIFNPYHKKIMLDANNGYGRFFLTQFNYNYFLDLYFWELVKFEDKKLVLTLRGLEVLKEIEKNERKPSDLLRKIDTSKNHCFENVSINNKEIPILSLTMTKKVKNLKIKAYQKVDIFNEIPNWMNDEILSQYISEFYVIFNGEVNNDLFKGHIGLMKEYEHNLYIQKRIKNKNIIENSKIGELLLSLLMQSKKENKYDHLVIC